MAVMTKTPQGTISAFRYTNGIAGGIYGKDNCVSLEYNNETGNLEILLMDDRIKEQGFIVKHVDKNWKEIKEE